MRSSLIWLPGITKTRTRGDIRIWMTSSRHRAISTSPTLIPGSCPVCLMTMVRPNCSRKLDWPIISITGKVVLCLLGTRSTDCSRVKILLCVRNILRQKICPTIMSVLSRRESCSRNGSKAWVKVIRWQFWTWLTIRRNADRITWMPIILIQMEHCRTRKSVSVEWCER